MESLKHIVNQLISFQNTGLALCQDSGETIEFNGQKFVADDTKGFLKFSLAHSFPVVTAYGQCLSANTVARSFSSLLFQVFDYEHRLKAYDPEKKTDDRILGTIVAVGFPPTPTGGFRFNNDRSSSPGIEGVACFSKLAHGMDKIIGQHKGGRHQYSVSMEVNFIYQDSGFVVGLKNDKPSDETPADLAASGFEYIPWAKASQALLDTFSVKKKRMISKYKNRDTYLMMGGIDGSVHFSGVGLVQYGAEREASVLQMAASLIEESDPMSPLRKLAALLTS